MTCKHKNDPVSAEALEVGLKFGCGLHERLIQEIAALRNVVQVALICEDKQKIIDSWNKHFPQIANWHKSLPKPNWRTQQ